MWDAFISHASGDMAAALRLEQTLHAAGLSAWVDHDNIRAGGLLIPALQDAIDNSRNIVVLWTTTAKASGWMTLEWNYVVNMNQQKETTVQKGVIPCRFDDTPLGFLLNYVYCDFRASYDTGAASLVTALRGVVEPTPAPAPFSPPDLAVQIMDAQADVLDALSRGDLTTAQRRQGAAQQAVDDALRRQPGDRYLLALAGYDKKNQYLIRYWDDVQAAAAPKDALLDQAAGLFFTVLASHPDDPSALNGLGSVFMLRRDLDAAEFYIRRSMVRATEEGFAYPEAEHDLQLIQYLKRQPATPAPAPEPTPTAKKTRTPRARASTRKRP